MMMKIIFLYPGNMVSSEYQGDADEVAAEFLTDLDEGHEYKFAETCFDIEAIPLIPYEDEENKLTYRQVNIDYDLEPLLSRFAEIGLGNIDGIILASHWNEFNASDMGQYGARDYASKIAIIASILENCSQLAGRFVALNGFLLHEHEINKYATEFFEPASKVEGNTCRMIQHFHLLRHARKNKAAGTMSR